MSSVTLDVTLGLLNGSGGNTAVCVINNALTRCPAIRSTGLGAALGTATKGAGLPNREQGAVRVSEQHYGAAPVEPRPESTVAELFVHAAVRCPDGTALLGSEGVLCYGDLLLRAQNVAVRLNRLGIRPGDVVGIVERRSFQTIAGVLGILLAGAAYMPFGMAESARLSSACAQTELLAQLENHRVTTMLVDGAADAHSAVFRPGAFRWVELAEIEREKMPLHAESALPEVDAESPTALVENGDDGRSAMSHRVIAHLVSSPQLFALRGAQTLLLATPMADQRHAMELWGALLGGSTLALAPDGPVAPQALPQLLREYRVSSLMLSSTAFISTAALAPEAFSGLHQLALYGKPSADEQIMAEPLDMVLASSPQLRALYSRWATDSGSYIHVEASRQRPGLDHTAALPEQPQAPPDMPVLEKEISTTLPNEAEMQERDDKVEQLEMLLRAHPLVEQCAVVPRCQPGVPVCAFVVLSTAEHAGEVSGLPASARARVAAEQLWAYLREQLPAEAPLARIVVRPELPLDAEGQPDGAQLEAEARNELRERRGPGRVDRSTYLAYAQQVQAIWAELLHRNDINLDDDFYTAGGSEIDMIRLHAEMNRRFPGAITMADLPVLRTVRTLMNHLLGKVARDRMAALEGRRAS